MVNYVNQEAFFKWYESVAKNLNYDKNELLDEVFSRYSQTHRGEFIVPADKSASGREEKYDFTFENLGCCGASTMFIYF